MVNLLHSCAKVREPMELSFGMVSGVGLGIHVLDGVQLPQGERAVSGDFRPHWFEWCIFRAEMCVES